MKRNQQFCDKFAQVLQETLDRPIAFHRVFVTLTGSVTAALMLSQALYWSKRTNTNDEGWFFKTRGQWEEETGLSRYEQEFARKSLRKFSFWKEQLRGVPAQMHYRVDIQAPSNELLCMESATEKPYKNARLLETSQLDGEKPANKKAGNQPTSLLDTSQHYKGFLETTTEINPPLTPLVPASNGPGGGCAFVEKLLTGSMLSHADPQRISKAAAKYRRTADEIEKAIDVLDQQYRQSTRKIDDPTALVVSALKDGVDPPEGYVPKAQREAMAEQRQETARRKAEEERRAKEEEDKKYRDAEVKLSALPEERREELFTDARKTLPVGLRNSQMAIKTQAIKMLIADARAPDQT